MLPVQTAPARIRGKEKGKEAAMGASGRTGSKIGQFGLPGPRHPRRPTGDESRDTTNVGIQQTWWNQGPASAVQRERRNEDVDLCIEKPWHPPYAHDLGTQESGEGNPTGVTASSIARSYLSHVFSTTTERKQQEGLSRLRSRHKSLSNSKLKRRSLPSFPPKSFVGSILHCHKSFRVEYVSSL